MADRASTTGSTAPAEAGTKRTRPWLRRVGVVLGCLLAGAIINVLVAWGCAYWSNQEDGLGFEQLETPAAWPSSYLEDLGLPPPDHAEKYKLLEGVGATVVFISGGDPEAGWESTDPPDRVWVRLMVHQFGLPFRSLQWETHGVNAGPRGLVVARELHEAAGLRTGIDVSQPLSGNQRALPLTPIVIGFVANTVLFALLLYSPFVVRVILRRAFRRRRGLCPSCAYDLRGADHGKCPECGEAVAGKRRQPNSRTAKQVVD